MKLLRTWLWVIGLAGILSFLFSVCMVIGNVIYDAAPIPAIAVAFVGLTLFIAYLIREATTLL